MSLIDEIRRDREAGTPGPWRAGASDFYPGLDGPLTVRVYTDHPVNEFDVCGDKSRPNAERIARVPDMEAALLAADEMQKRLADCITYMDTREKMVPGMARVCDMAVEALAAYREAVK